MTEDFEDFRFYSLEQGEKAAEEARQALMDIHMNLIRKFLRDGEDHGTVVEALYEAFRAIQTGEAQDIPEALYIGASEWYK
jgi:uncharacterized protein YutE (UPF0331/DUF86 family)